MTNTALIEHLDATYAHYAQRQKTTAALQKIFKSVADSTAQAARILGEYDQFAQTLDVSRARAAFDGLTLRQEAIDPLTGDLRREIRMIAALTGALRDAAAALRLEPVDVARLDKAIAVLETSTFDEMPALCDALREELRIASRSLGDEFGIRLRDALAAVGIDIGGRPPHYEIGRFVLEGNFAKRQILIRYGKDVVVPRAALTVEAAVKGYQTARRLVISDRFDGESWLAQFYEAYTRVRARAGNSDRVGLVECYRELWMLNQPRAFQAEPGKGTAKDYPRAQFIYEFARVVSEERRRHNGLMVRAHVASKSQVESPLRSMWVVEGISPADGRFIGDIEFVRE
jgi:hypothetical protein